LILLTNDGDIVNEILRSENEHEKEYVVSVNRPITDLSLKMLASGVKIMGETTKPCKVERIDAETFRMVLTQGLNRQIRRMCSALGYRVRRLQRVRIINIHVGACAPASGAILSDAEVANCSGLAAASPAALKRRQRGRRRRLPTIAAPWSTRQSGSCARAASQRKKSSP
jgi:23S rRNA pseudouridine2604 synthase